MQVIVSKENTDRIWVTLRKGETLETLKTRPRLFKVWAEEDYTEICVSPDVLAEAKFKTPKVSYLLYVPTWDFRFSGTYKAIKREEALEILSLKG